MDRLILLILLCLFLIAIGKLILEGEWGYAASIIVGLLTARHEIKQLWEESQTDGGD